MGQRPNAILEEVRVHNGNAIADVVTIHKHAHCYEIKGSTDNIYRALKQSVFYGRAFKKMTLVTTENYIETAERVMPTYWGIITAKIDKNRIKLSYLRPAKANPTFIKKVALHTLWKSELLDSDQIRNLRGAKNLNRDQLIEIISQEATEDNLLNFIGDKLSKRAITQGNY